VDEPDPDTGALPARVAATLVFVAAAAVLVLEILALRLIAPYVGITLQTNTAVIGSALTAIAVGAWLGGRLADLTDPGRLLGPLLLVAAVLTLVTLPAVRYVGEALGDSPDVSAVLLLALATVFAPAALLSAVAPMVVKLQLTDLRRTGTVVGRLSGIGTLGAIAATFGTGFVLVGALPVSAILIGTAAVVAAAGAAVLLLRRGRPGNRAGLSALAAVPLVAALVVAAPNPCQRETAYHCANVQVDSVHSGGRLLKLDSLRHSYVDLADPRYLEFAYTRAIASVADVAAPAGAPVRALHIGGGGFTMPRYLASTRLGSTSTVLEIDPGVVRLGRDRLGVNDIPGLTVDVGDARTGLARQPSGAYDLVVGDAFGGLAVPWHLTTREMAEQIARVLSPDGVYAVNVIDYPPSRFATAEAATLRTVFPYVILLAAEGLGGGNHILVGSRRPLPLAALTAALTGRQPDWVVVEPADTAEFAGTADVLTDDHAPVDQLITYN
jgi:hypothetical protein